MQVIDPRELNDLAAFASRGGLGQGVALTDCVAEQPDQLMYLSGDSLILLRDLGDILLASCEGVVGWVERDHVRFEGLASVSALAVKKGGDGVEDGEVPRSIIVQSPSPPRMPHISLPNPSKDNLGRDVEDKEISVGQSGSLGVDEKEEDRRASNPFELDSPLATPSVESTRQGFQLPATHSAPSRPIAKGTAGAQEELMDDIGRTPASTMPDDPRRESMESVNSSSFGGIGGFMMGGGSFDEHEHEHEYERSPGLTEMADSPITPGHSQTPQSIIITTPSKPHADHSPTSLKSPHSAASWDIYDTHSQSQLLDSPYTHQPQVSTKRKETPSIQSDGSSTSSSPIGFRNSVMSNSSWDDEGRAFEAARLALERVGKGRKWVDEEEEEGRRSGEVERKASVAGSVSTRSSVSTGQDPPPRPARRRPVGVDMINGVEELKEGEQNRIAPSTPKLDSEDDGRELQPNTPLAIRKEAEEQKEDDLPPLTPRTAHRKDAETTPKRLVIANPDSGDEDEPDEVPSARQSSDGNHVSDVSTEIITPHPPSEETMPSAPTEQHEPLTLSPAEIETTILPSSDKTPLNKVEPVIALTDPSHRTESIILRTPGPPSRRIAQAHNLPMVPPINTFQTGSPSSPHSVDATRRAVEAVRKTPEATRKRGMTLMGRMEADLGQAKGPVPITFLVGDNFPPPLSPAIPAMGYGVPPGSSGRISPAERKGSAPSPLAPPFMDTSVDALKTIPSPYPFMRSATNPLPPPQPEITTLPSAAGSMPKPGFFPRPRSRSFSAAVSKVIAKKAGPGLTIKTDIPALPSSSSAISSRGPVLQTAGGSVKRPFFSRQASMPSSATLAPSASSSNLPIPSTPVSPAISLSPDIIGIINHVNESNASLAPPSARSSSFSFRKVSKGSKTSLGPSTTSPTRPLPSPVSNKDYEDTVKADGLDFEIIQPKRGLSTSTSDHTLNEGSGIQEGADLERKGTVISSTSGRSLRTLPDTDEWGFIKEKSPTPEIFTGRAGGAGQRALEQKWLGIINTPITNGQPPKKIRKLAIESGIPASLRGRVWAWFMMPIMSARRPGLYQELLEHDREDKRLAQRIDSDVEAAYPDHSIYSETSTGQSDLRSILRAYSHFATGGYRSEMALIAGMLLIHCVAEDAFWLLSGFVNGVLKDYYASPSGGGGVIGGKAPGMKIDAAVFAGVLHGSEPKLARLFKDIGLHPIMFLEEWYTKLFIRCLPWPTALRIIDAVVAEGGPRFLLIASLTILTLSRDRLLALPRTYTDVLAYLRELPQDALLLPEPFMKACENVKFREEDLMRLRKGVEKELGL